MRYCRNPADLLGIFPAFYELEGPTTCPSPRFTAVGSREGNDADRQLRVVLSDRLQVPVAAIVHRRMTGVEGVEARERVRWVSELRDIGVAAFSIHDVDELIHRRDAVGIGQLGLLIVVAD